MVRKWDILKGDNTGARAGKSEADKQWWGANAPPPPIFADQFTYPISTGRGGGTDYAHQLLHAPPDF